MIQKTPQTVILAGGQGERMQGQDKGLLRHESKVLVEHVLDALPSAWRANAIVVANRHQQQYQRYANTVISDAVGDYDGPIAGLLSAHMQDKNADILLLACDTVGLTGALLYDLYQQWQQQPQSICLAQSPAHQHYLLGFYPANCLQDLPSYYDNGGRSMHGFVARHASQNMHIAEDIINLNYHDQLSP